MSATTAGYSAEAGTIQSPDNDSPSPVFPDRPIRPLPRRRLRSRLSVEQADSITYPPVPPSSSPLYGAPHGLVERNYGEGHYIVRNPNDADEAHEHVCQSCGTDHPLESDEEDDERIPTRYRHSWSAGAEPTHRYPLVQPETHHRPPPPNSSRSSADGYESFENTNNKKKRKIPTTSGSGVPVSPDVAGGGVPTQSVNVPYPDSRLGGSGVGISGAGRDRNSRAKVRPHNERRPLANTSNNFNAYANATRSDKGIISTAMANAEGSNPMTTAAGQENVSLLQRQGQTKDGSKDFTFHAQSTSAERMAQAQANLPPAPPTFPRTPTVPTTSRARAGTANAASSAATPTSQYAAANPPPAQQAAPPPQKPRRDPNWWRRSASRRKDQKRMDNYYNPPDPADPNANYWCLFCEYEQIYGYPMIHLGKSYEIKERRRRREREAHQKRLQVAKEKSRKGKKAKSSSKNSSLPTTNTSTGAHNQPYDPAYADPAGPHPDDVSQGEDFFDDEEYDDMPPLAMPAPLDPHGSLHGEGVSIPPPPLRGGGNGLDGFPELDRSQSLPAHM